MIVILTILSFNILYKQDVTTEDVYLGMSDKDPSSNSCNVIVYRIELPGEELSDINLVTTRTKLLVQSPNL